MFQVPFFVCISCYEIIINVLDCVVYFTELSDIIDEITIDGYIKVTFWMSAYHSLKLMLFLPLCFKR